MKNTSQDKKKGKSTILSILDKPVTTARGEETCGKGNKTREKRDTWQSLEGE